MLNVGFGETVTVNRSAYDDFGNRQPPATHTVSSVALVLSRGSGQQAVAAGSGDAPYESRGSIYAPRGADLVDGDIFSRVNGQQYRVVGPAQWDFVHPMTGTDFGYCEFTIERA